MTMESFKAMKAYIAWVLYSQIYKTTYILIFVYDNYK
jgi:hypothetical protein